MDEKFIDKYHRAMGDFYYFIVWGMTERLVRELKPPSLDNLKTTIFDPFIRYLEGNMTRSEFEKTIKKELTRYGIDTKIQEYMINIFETFIERLSQILKDAKTASDLKRVTDEYLIVQWFDKEILETAYTLLALEGTGYGKSLEARGQLLEIIKSFVISDVNLDEAIELVEKLLEANNFRKVLSSAVSSIIIGVLKATKKIGIEKAAQLAKTRIRDLKIPLSGFLKTIDKRGLLIHWFGYEILQPCLRAMEAVGISEDATAIREDIIKSFGLLVDRLLTLEQFHKRIMNLLKPHDKKTQQVKAHVAASIMSVAELIHDELENDPSLGEFTSFLEERQKQRDRFYT
ncbi:MAG: hypothetical protein ACFFA1_03900 [Promethearchaeota archaeon]